MQNNSAAEHICGGFTGSKIWRLFRRSVIFLADFRRTDIWRRSAAAEGSTHASCVVDASVKSVKTTA